MTEQELHIDPDHLLPDEEWAAVVRRAKAIRTETREQAQGGAASGIAPVLDMTAAGIRSGKYFAVSGIATQLLVLHSAECPLAGGYAQSLTEWAASVYPQAPIASWQRFVDPLVRLRFIPDELGAWHASEANVNSIGWEQAGYARFTRAEWLTPDGRTQLESLAFDMAEVAVRDGIPARWLSDAEVVAATQGGNRSIKGFCTHRQIDPETRTDPGTGYPYDLLMERIIFYMGGGAPETTPTEQDDEMLYIVQRKGDNSVWIGDLKTRRHVTGPDDLRNLQFLATSGKANIFDGGKVQVWDTLDTLGVDLSGMYDRQFGRDVQRWFNPATLEVRTEPFPGAVAARSTDVHDVLATNTLVQSSTTRILDAVAAVPDMDPAVVEDLRAELSAAFEEVKQGLKVTLAYTPDLEPVEVAK